VMSPKRSQALPQVPTMTEVGFPELKLGSWQAMFVPKGTPKPIVSRLYTVMIKTVEDPETARRLNAGGAEIVTSKSPEETDAFLREQTEFWAKIVKSIGATAE
ncbi:MAG: Bug family tripartite tricarboxylate transporter substrate binding protein, partial [Gemmatimonadaceae bacterium]